VRKIKVDSHHRELLKFYIFTSRTHRMFLDNVSLLAKLETAATLCDKEVARSGSKQSMELGVSFPAHIQTLLTPMFFLLR